MHSWKCRKCSPNKVQLYQTMKTIHRLILTALMALSTHAFGLGLQMYSLQEDFDLDTPGTLDRLKAQGFTDLETSVFTKLPAAELKALLRARGMTCSSHHVRPETLEKNMDQVIADAKALGAVQVVCPILPHPAPSCRTRHRWTVRRCSRRRRTSIATALP